MLFLILVVVVAVIAVALTSSRRPGRGSTEQRGDAEAEARRWVDRLGASIVNLDDRGDVAARQALADASERLTAAASQLATAASVTQFRLVGQSAVEGLYYVRAARIALGLDPGPDIPDPDPRQRFGTVTQPGQVSYDGHDYAASPTPGPATPYYYPGGMAGGRPVPAGWYSTPWWKTALVAGAAGIGGLMLVDLLLGGGRGGFGGGFGRGFGGGRGGFGGGFGRGFGGGPGGFGGFGGGFGGGPGGW